MRLLIDSNIFLDILYQRENLYEGSKELFYHAKNNKDQLYINASSLKDIYYFAYKKMHDKKQSRLFIYNIYQIITKVVDCSSDDAISSIFDEGDYEDNMLRSAANRTMCDAIITRNIKDFANKDINCFTPEEYLLYRN